MGINVAVNLGMLVYFKYINLIGSALADIVGYHNFLDESGHYQKQALGGHIPGGLDYTTVFYL